MPCLSSLKKGGLKDENIIVFMYDDIAFNEENPRKGIIINRPDGDDVYAGVPKDYTGKDVTVGNFFAALLGNKTALTGGSGKVVDSGPNDHIFIYYTDHGGPGVLGMPTNPYLYANDLIDVLKKKHASGSYKSMAFYLEACESGSIFEGILPEGLNIYATTASNAEESSWGTYCPGDFPGPPPNMRHAWETYIALLGWKTEKTYFCIIAMLFNLLLWMHGNCDMLAISHVKLQKCDVHNLRTETLQQQYQLVKWRTINQNTEYGSHVMQYGDIKLSKEQHLFLYMGTNPANDNSTFRQGNSLPSSAGTVNQRDADLLHFWHKYRKAPEGSARKINAQKQFFDVMAHRMHVDHSMKLVGGLLFGFERGPEVLKAVRPAGQPLVDDWGCLKAMVRNFETHCGSLSQYGMKHMRAFANICNAGVEEQEMASALTQACTKVPSVSWSSMHDGGFSA
ncbi:hypothetical protein Scep_024570 [Stephania cephalantha]|uniref:Legumain prodomain domain-containing protein n=1 Tax=Stephania cephalantha TaxID=152367 RepID=A0AAP0EWT2_9MAGN